MMIHLRRLISTLFCVSPHLIFLANSYESSVNSKSTLSYENARNIRVKNGHSSAVPLYRSLLEKHRGDLTAASRIAAAKSSPERHDLACPLPGDRDDTRILNDIKELRAILRGSEYDNHHVQTIFNIPHYRHEDGQTNHKLSFASGPVYIKPVPAGSKFYPLDIKNEETESDSTQAKTNSLKCLVTLFLLGLCVPYETAAKSLLGGEGTIALFQRLGLLHPCEMDPHILVPYVHLFPMDVENCESPRVRKVTTQLVLVTDCHPVILGKTSVGVNEDGAVMYIGPDSLALVQNLPLSTHSLAKTIGGTNEIETFSILDFCAGSGVQAISALTAVKSTQPNAKATFVDINDRALRFCIFNAILNELNPHNIRVIKGDLINGNVISDCIGNEYGYKSEKETQVDNESCLENNLLTVLTSNICKKGSVDEVDNLKSSLKYDLILSNPPFIPVPSLEKDFPVEISDQEEIEVTFDNISKRYGLFSSGGSSGEEVLRTILCLSGRLLKASDSNNRHSLLAIVSEFMDPPIEKEDSQSLLMEKMRKWWRGVDLNDDLVFPFLSGSTYPDIVLGKGVLFTNEYPVSSSVYANRRSDDQSEYNLWFEHLNRLKIRTVSPGLLFVRTRLLRSTSLCDTLELSHFKVPKTEQGSVWTPSNYNAVNFIKNELSLLLKRN